MLGAFRSLVSQALNSPEELQHSLQHFAPGDWQGVAELFAARLPEFDAVYAAPGAQHLAASVARTRGVPSLSTPSELPLGQGELVILSAHLQDGQAELEAAQAAQQAGWQVLMVVAAVERTNRGARTRLTEQHFPVRAALQVADTPRGLVFERRAPERWTVHETPE